MKLFNSSSMVDSVATGLSVPLLYLYGNRHLLYDLVTVTSWAELATPSAAPWAPVGTFSYFWNMCPLFRIGDPLYLYRPLAESHKSCPHGT